MRSLGRPVGGGAENQQRGIDTVDSCANTWAGSPLRHVPIFLSRPNLTQLRPPKFDNIEAQFRMWCNKFQACLSSLGFLYVLETTDNPVTVGGMNVSQEESG